MCSKVLCFLSSLNISKIKWLRNYNKLIRKYFQNSIAHDCFMTGAKSDRKRCRNTGKSRSREAEKPRSREVEKSRSREAEKPRSREAEILFTRNAKQEQKGLGIGIFSFRV
jgi:hypothetical protein